MTTNQLHSAAYWRPLWLRRATLLAFMALFVLLSIGLTLTSYLVKIHDGIPLSLTMNHYSWTYGPTAILVVIIGFWRRVSYCVMVNQPWHQLHEGPRPSTETVLLDYVWPLQIVSFYAALKCRHFAVAAAILIFALLKVIMVISTTLFVLGNSSASQDIRIRLETKFDASYFWNSTPPVILSGYKNDTYYQYYPVYEIGVDQELAFTNISAGPVWDYLNLQRRYPDTSAPIELSTAFTNYSIISSLPANPTQVSAHVDTFRINTTCEVADASWFQDEQAATLNVTLTTPSCDIGKLEIEVCTPPTLACPLIGRTFAAERVNCTGAGTSNTVYLSETTPNTYQYAIIVVESDLSTRSETDYEGTIYRADVQRLTAVSCSLTYSIQQSAAKGPATDTTHITSLDAMEGPEGLISNFTSLQLMEAVFSSLQEAYNVFDENNPSVATLGSQALLGLLAGSTTVTNLDPLFDPQTLQRKVQEVLNGVSQQLIRRYFLLPDDTEAPASVIYSYPKLYIRPAILWTMVGLSTLAAALVTVVIVYTKENVAPHAPELLATAAYVLSRSPAMAQLLEGSGGMRSSELRQKFGNYGFVTVQDRAGTPCVEVVSMNREKTPPNRPGLFSRMQRTLKFGNKKRSNDLKPKSKPRWMPYSARRHAITLTLLLPVFLVAVLEILSHYSERNEDFVVVSSDYSISTYAIRYGSTATVLIIANLFNALDFSVATMAPFSALAAVDSPAEHNMIFSIIGDLPPVALYKAVIHMHIGAALSQIASTIGSILTIAASGLWFYDTSIEISRVVATEVQSGWSIDFALTNGSSSTAVSLFNQRQHGSGINNATLIWEDVVLPTVSYAQLQVSSALQANDGSDADVQRYNLAVPAIQPFLECSVLPQSALRIDRPIEWDLVGIPRYRNRFTVSAELPDGCTSSPLDTTGKLSNIVSFTTSVETNHGGSNEPNWVGMLSDLDVIAASDPVPFRGCPSIGAIYGSYDATDLASNHTITAVICTQRLQSVETEAIYSSSGALPLSLVAAPLASSPGTSPTVLVDMQSGISSLSNHVKDSFDLHTTPFGSRPRQRFDLFFDHLIGGPGGTLHEELLGPSNSAALAAAMDALYKRFMACVIDVDYRISLNNRRELNATTKLQPILNGGVVQGTITANVSRLKLNKTSKIILEAFLGTMFVLGGLAYWRVQGMRDTIPRNPYSIASGMAFFAGSRFLDELIEENKHSTACDGNESNESFSEVEERRRREVAALKGRLFGLGWWNNLTVSRNADGNAYSTTSFSQARPLYTEVRFGIDVAMSE